MDVLGPGPLGAGVDLRLDPFPEGVAVGPDDRGAAAARTEFGRIPWRTLGVDGEAEPARDAVTVRCLQRPDGSLPEADDEDDLVAVGARSC